MDPRPSLCLIACLGASCVGRSGVPNDETEGVDLPDPLRPLTTTFDAPLGPEWTEYNGSLVTTTFTGGVMQMDVVQAGNWYNDAAGNLLHANVDGDFVITAFVRARRQSDPLLTPDYSYRLAGLLAGNLVSTTKNYVKICLGSSDYLDAVESKTTINGSSTWTPSPNSPTDAQLRICRRGSVFQMLFRPLAGGAFTTVETYDRSDLPSALAVGFFTESNDAPPDIRGTFEWAVLSTPQTDADCLADVASP